MYISNLVALYVCLISHLQKRKEKEIILNSFKVDRIGQTKHKGWVVEMRLSPPKKKKKKFVYQIVDG